MGCGSSKITVVEPVKPGGLDVNEVVAVRAAPRGDSAASRKTTDSGVGLDGDTTVLPGAVPRILPPLRAQSPGLPQDSQRPESSEILEQLMKQGIITAHPKVGGSGEAYNIVLDDAGTPRRRPPPRLESLKTRKEQEVTKKKDIDEKMRQVEERRKVREEELRTRLRAKSARPRRTAPVGDISDAPLTSHLPPTAKEYDPDSGEGEPVEGRLSGSLENDSTFQQTDDADEF